DELRADTGTCRAVLREQEAPQRPPACDEHRARSAVDHLSRDRSKDHRSDPAPAAASDHDEVGLRLFGFGQDDVGSTAEWEGELDCSTGCAERLDERLDLRPKLALG